VSPVDGDPEARRVVVTDGSGSEISNHVQVVDLNDSPALLLPPGVSPESNEVAAVRAVLDRLARRQGQPDDVGKIGSFLFDSLIGAAVWSASEDVKAATDAGEELLVELAWPAEDGVMNGVPWEAMRNDTGFLAGASEPKVVIVRVVPGAGALTTTINRPPRVLFVIGSSLADDRIRAGAEVLSMLRASSLNNARMIADVVDDASVESMTTAVKRFRPDAVHVVAHGGRDAGGSPAVLMRPSSGSTTLTSAGDDPVTADRLETALRFDDGQRPGRLPDLVVLSACDSARSWSDASGPLAASLVKLGVPVVVAMGGRVSDAACRLFARGFGRGLLNGQAMALAAAAGRRAAFAGGYSPSSLIDWALPTMFLAEMVDPSAPLVGSTASAELPQLLEALRIEEMVSAPVFFGRREFFKHLDDVLEGRMRTLIAHSTHLEGLGARRLLRELARVALFRGFVPIYPQNDSGATMTLVELLVELEKVALALRKQYSVPVPPALALLEALDISTAAGSNRTLAQGLKAVAGEAAKGTTATQDLVEAVADDLIQFAADFGPHLPVENANPWPIIFISGLDLLAGDVDEFFRVCAGDRQMQSSANGRIPIVATTSTYAIESHKSKHPRYVVFEELCDFDITSEEDLHAYAWVTMHPRPAFSWPPARTRAWVFEKPDPQGLEELRSWLSPARPELFDLELYKHLRTDYGFRKADDEDVLPDVLKLEKLL
jgi:hypothetical protein